MMYNNNYCQYELKFYGTTPFKASEIKEHDHN